MAEWIALTQLALVPVPGRIVADDGDGALAHPAFVARVRDWQAAFATRPETHWALYVERTPEFAAALFGAWHAGKRVYLPGDALPGTLEALRRHVQAFAGDVPATCAPLHAEAGIGKDAALDALDETTTQVAVFTSGSTGQPVAIEKRLAELAREIEAQETAFGDASPVVVHGTVSHQHIYGLLHRVLWPLAAGRPIGRRLFFPEDLARVLAQGDTSWLVASPAHLKRLPEAIDWQAVHGRVRRVFSSGGALPPGVGPTAARLLGTPPVEIYGSSETGGIAWRCWDSEQPVWRALPGVAWRIDEGALVVQSPHLPPDGGEWRTQDRAQADGDGGFRLLGRVDRIVKLEERRISLDALERDLLAHPAIAEAKMVVLEEGARQVLAAVLVANETGRASLDDVGRRGLAAELGRHLAVGHDAVVRPRRWRFVDSLPVDAQGKTTARALAALFRPEFPQVEWRLRDSVHAEVEFVLDPALAVFEGHFPQAAILPGVAQVDWAIRLGREAFALPPEFLRLDALKFQRVARPGDRIHLRLDWDASRASLAFRYTSVSGTHASGRAVFGGGA